MILNCLRLSGLALGFLYPTGSIVGYFTSANKLIGTARSAFSPIADSLYPYMIKNKDYKLIKKILTMTMPIIIVGCIGVGIFAEPICVLLFGFFIIEGFNYLEIKFKAKK